MTNKFCGILDIDYPELSGDDRRLIQLGELDTLPDGKPVADYVAEVELQKELSLLEAAEKRESDLTELSTTQPKTDEDPAEAQDDSEAVTDEDLYFGPEEREESDDDDE